MTREESVPAGAWLRSAGNRRPALDADDAVIDSMLKARRFDEVSRALSSDDVERRARLAATRGGPLVDLWRYHREDAKSPLGKRCGELLKPHVPGLVRVSVGRPNVDETGRNLASAQNELSRHDFRAAAGRYANLRFRFPEADERQEWAYGEALARSLAGEYDDARTAAADAAALDRNRRLRESASKLRLAIGTRDSHDWHVLSWRDRVPRVVDDVYRKKRGAAFILWPSQIRALATWDGFDVGMVEATPKAFAALIDAGVLPWIGLFLPGRVRVYGVAGVSPDLGVVALDDGTLMLWDDMIDRSMWGDLAIAGRAAGSAPEAPALDHDPAFEGPPCDADGGIAFEPATLDVLREHVKAHPDRLIVHSAYLGVLGDLAQNENYGTTFHAEYARAIAVARLRFPTSPVPVNQRLNYLTYVSDSDAVVLGAADDAAEFGLATSAAAALGLREHPLTRHYLREAMRLAPTRSELVRFWINAAQRIGDLDEIESALEVFRALEPNHPSIPTFDALVALSRRGPRAYRDETEPSEHLHDMRANAALRTLDPAVLGPAADEALGIYTDSYLGRFARVYRPLCEGDGEAVLAAVVGEASAWGLSDAVCDVLTAAIGAQIPRDHDAAIVAAIEPFARSQGAQVGYVANVLSWTPRWSLAVELGERQIGGGDANPGDVWSHAERLARIASHAPAGDAQRLRERALELVDLIRPLARRFDQFHVLRGAILRHRDLDAAWDAATTDVDSSDPVHAWVVAAAIAEDRGDLEGALRLRSRAAVPPALRRSVSQAYRLGILREVASVVPLLDPAASATTLIRLHGLGVSIPTLPSVPDVEWAAVFDQSVTRLADEGAWSHLEAVARWRASMMPVRAAADFGPIVAGVALADAAGGDGSGLARLAETSRHPAVVRAVSAAARHGLGFADEAAALAPFAPEFADGEVTL